MPEPLCSYNLVQTILSFYLFVDVVADQKIRYVGEAAAVTGYEKARCVFRSLRLAQHPAVPPAPTGCSPPCLQAAAAFLFLNFVLSLLSNYFTVQAIGEVKQKQRETRWASAAAAGPWAFFRVPAARLRPGAASLGAMVTAISSPALLVLSL